MEHKLGPQKAAADDVAKSDSSLIFSDTNDN